MNHHVPSAQLPASIPFPDQSSAFATTEDTLRQHITTIAAMHGPHRMIVFWMDMAWLHTTAGTMLGVYLRRLLLVHIMCCQHPRSLCMYINRLARVREK